MKMRGGFVSNSSTASFILAAKDEASLVVSFAGTEVDLGQYATPPDGRILRSPQDLEDLIDEFFSWWADRGLDDARETSWYVRARACLAAGRIVLFGEIPMDYGGEFENACSEFGLQGVLLEHADLEVIRYEGA